MPGTQTIRTAAKRRVILRRLFWIVLGAVISALVGTGVTKLASIDLPFLSGGGSADKSNQTAAPPRSSKSPQADQPTGWSPVRSFPAHDGTRVASVAFSRDGGLLASGGHDTMVWLWNAATGEKIAELAGHGNKVNAVAFSPTADLLASAGLDANIRLWNPVSKSHLTDLRAGAGANISSLVFSRNGNLLAAGRNDGRVHIFDVTSQALIRTLSVSGESVNYLAFSPDNRTLATANSKGEFNHFARLWDATTGGKLHTLTGHTNWLGGVGFNNDGQVIFTTSGDQTIRAWNTSNGVEQSKFTGVPSWVSYSAQSHDGSTIALAHGPDVVLRRSDTFAVTASLTGEFTGEIMSVALSPNGTAVAACGDDGTIGIWHKT